VKTMSSVNSPVDNATYNLMQALLSKLEAIEAYDRYARDDGGQLFTELLEDERMHADRLLEQLRRRLNG
jgi:rubrerythrin